jgi:hypothetical protein
MILALLQLKQQGKAVPLAAQKQKNRVSEWDRSGEVRHSKSANYPMKEEAFWINILNLFFYRDYKEQWNERPPESKEHAHVPRNCAGRRLDYPKYSSHDKLPHLVAE